jgi:hypothetical protein
MEMKEVANPIAIPTMVPDEAARQARHRQSQATPGQYNAIDYDDMVLRANMLHIPIEAMLNCVKKYSTGLKAWEADAPNLTFCKKWNPCVEDVSRRFTKECQELCDIAGGLGKNLHGWKLVAWMLPPEDLRSRISAEFTNSAIIAALMLSFTIPQVTSPEPHILEAGQAYFLVFQMLGGVSVALLTITIVLCTHILFELNHMMSDRSLYWFVCRYLTATPADPTRVSSCICICLSSSQTDAGLPAPTTGLFGWVQHV